MIRSLITAFLLVSFFSTTEGNDTFARPARCVVTIRSASADTTVIRILDGMRVSDLLAPDVRWNGILLPGDSVRAELVCRTGYVTVLIDSIFDVTYSTRPDDSTTHLSFVLRDTLRMKMPIRSTVDDMKITTQHIRSIRQLERLTTGDGSSRRRIASIDSAMPGIIRELAGAAGTARIERLDWAPYRDLHAMRLFDIIQMLRKDTAGTDVHALRRYLDSSCHLIRTAYDTDERVSNSVALQLLCQASLLANAALQGYPDVDSTIATLCRALRSFRDVLVAASCPTADRITSLNFDYRLASMTSDFTYDDLVGNDDFRKIWHRSSDTTLLRAIIDRHFQLGTGRKLPDIRIVDRHGMVSTIVTHDSTTIIYFWGTWCGPCLQTIGRMHIDSVSSVLHRYGARLVFVAVERNDHGDEWKKIGRKYGFDGHSVRAAFPIGSAAARAFGILGLPMMRVVAADGTIRSMDYAPLDDIEAFTRHIRQVTHR